MMRRRQTILGVRALSLAIANLVAMPHTLAALSEFSGGGASLSPVMSSSGGCGCASTSFEKNPDEHSGILAYSPVQLGLPLCAIPYPVNDPTNLRKYASQTRSYLLPLVMGLLVGELILQLAGGGNYAIT